MCLPDHRYPSLTRWFCGVAVAEPILTEGGTTFTTWKDGWTLQASDGALNAQVEHTVLITDSGVEVLTEDV